MIEPSASDKAVYEQHVKHLQKSYSTSKYSLATITTLLEETTALRKKWIVEDCPTVKEILEKFPCLKEPKMVIIIFHVFMCGIGIKTGKQLIRFGTHINNY